MSKREFLKNALVLAPFAAVSSRILAADNKILGILAAQVEGLKRLAGIDGTAGLYKAGEAPGSTTGAAIAAGFIGEKKQATIMSASVVTARKDFQAMSEIAVTIPAGVWLVQVAGSVYLSNSGLASGYTLADFQIWDATTGSQIAFQNEACLVISSQSGAFGISNQDGALSMVAVVECSNSRTLQLRCRTEVNGTVSSVAIGARPGTSLLAVRIA